VKVTVADKSSRQHLHHAESYALSASLKLPLTHEIEPHGHARLLEDGKYVSHKLESFRHEGIVSYRSAFTHVVGGRDDKPGHGWNTLSTSVIEGLNILEVVTADRIVAQIATEHPLVGYVPSVTFLGTRFENLCIGGYPVKVDLDLNMLGSKPKKDAAYSSDRDFAKRVKGHYERIRSQRDVPPEVAARYKQLNATSKGQRLVECSLVKQVEGGYPGRNFGHVIDVPNFGKVYLATVRIDESDFNGNTPKKTLITLKMLEVKMGCLASGSMDVGVGKTNGVGTP
jgi:hypothetical protein